MFCRFLRKKIVDLSIQRAKSILNSVEGGDPGSMIAVSATKENLQPILARLKVVIR
jgi:hypothetical protein